MATDQVAKPDTKTLAGGSRPHMIFAPAGARRCDHLARVAGFTLRPTTPQARRSSHMMKSAWIITQDDTRQDTEVIGILSARKSPQTVKAYVEWLYALLNYSASEHIGFANYLKASVPYKAEFWTTNTGVPMETLMLCSHNPHLVAQLAKDVTLIEGEREPPVLQWTQPHRLVCDKDTRQIVEKIPGLLLSAPVHLPLRIEVVPEFRTSG